MDPHDQLHRTLRAAANLLDSAASQVCDMQLQPTKQHLRSIGEALALVFEVQHAVEGLKPELAKRYEEPTEEESLANRRLGEAFIAADDLAERENNESAEVFLERFAAHEHSSFHRDLALLQAARYKLRDGT